MGKQLHEIIGLGVTSALITFAQPVDAQLLSTRQQAAKQSASEIPQLSHLNSPATSTQRWFNQLEHYDREVAQRSRLAQAIIQVTNVRINTTAAGI